jgi:uncharacterized protein
LRTRGGVLIANIIAGLVLGYTVANIGYGDYAELNRNTFRICACSLPSPAR